MSQSKSVSCGLKIWLQLVRITHTLEDINKAPHTSSIRALISFRGVHMCEIITSWRSLPPLILLMLVIDINVAIWDTNIQDGFTPIGHFLMTSLRFLTLSFRRKDSEPPMWPYGFLRGLLFTVYFFLFCHHGSGSNQSHLYVIPHICWH